MANLRKIGLDGVILETWIYRRTLTFCNFVCQEKYIFFHFLINIWFLGGGYKVDSKDFLKGKATGD